MAGHLKTAGYEGPAPPRVDASIGGVVLVFRDLVSSQRESDHTDCAARDCDSMVVTRSQAQSHLLSHPQSQAILRKPLHPLTKPHPRDPCPGPSMGAGKSRERPAETCGFAARQGVPPSRLSPGRSRLDLSLQEGGRAGVAVRRSARVGAVRQRRPVDSDAPAGANGRVHRSLSDQVLRDRVQLEPSPGRRIQREADSSGTDGVSTCFARSPLRFDPAG